MWYILAMFNFWFIEACEYIDGFMQERRNSIASALELCISFTNPSIYASVNWVIIGRDKFYLKHTVVKKSAKWWPCCSRLKVLKETGWMSFIPSWLLFIQWFYSCNCHPSLPSFRIYDGYRNNITWVQQSQREGIQYSRNRNSAFKDNMFMPCV